MGDDVDGPTAFHSGGLVGIHHVDRNAYANLRPFAKSQKIDVNGQILDRVELKVARDHPVLGAVDIEIVDGGEKAAGIDALLELGMIDRDVQGRFTIAVNHARHASTAKQRPSGAPTGELARRRLHLLGRRHVESSSAMKRWRAHSSERVRECYRAQGL